MKYAAKQNIALLKGNIVYTCKMGKAYILQINNRRAQYISGVYFANSEIVIYWR